MPNSENHDLFRVVVIEHNIRSLPKFDDPFSELRRHFLNRTAYPRLLSKSFYAIPNCSNRALRGFRTLRNKKGMEAAYVKQRSL